ncbi:hypothetical protein VTK56DRAFT_2212 [Thermocarpiscus australiensis]
MSSPESTTPDGTSEPYMLVPNFHIPDSTADETDLASHSWMVAILIEDDDIMFGGKPLSACVSCLAAITPLIYAWQAQNAGGDAKKKPLLYSSDQAPLYRPGLISNLIMFALAGGISALIPLSLMYLNRRHVKRREERGKNSVLMDESMVGKKHMEDTKAVEIEDAGGKWAAEGARGGQ